MTALSLTCLSLTLASLVTLSNAATSCKNEKNADVDWFFMYKLPRGAQGKDKVSVPRGEEYLYIDSRTPTSTPYWMLSTHNIFNESNALANTIAPLTATEKPESLAYAVYNDQPPYHLEEKKSSNGHTKGLFIFDGESGVWIIHSVPKFPEMLHKGQYSFPPSGREYGQTILCVTFPTSQLETIDVYSAAVASNLESNLFVSTWRNGAGGKVPADCNDTYTVTNIDALRFKMSKQQLDVRNGEDHSKWAISEESSRRYVCIGTLNRMHSQYRRGGQTLCFKNALLHKLLLRSVTEFDNCNISR
ncbi:plancitoxin-1-like isoform X2 [Dermacentor variabilis]|uniref:plancitoxin-1-like isoform X2 n=1 Tax=Dermacentor variabilis TaxID=34621 RepID=UPI003F5C4E2D